MIQLLLVFCPAQLSRAFFGFKLLSERDKCFNDALYTVSEFLAGKGTCRSLPSCHVAVRILALQPTLQAFQPGGREPN